MSGNIAMRISEFGTLFGTPRQAINFSAVVKLGGGNNLPYVFFMP